MTTKGLQVKSKTIVVPGEVLAKGLDHLPGYGTYRAGDNIHAGMLGLTSVDGRTIAKINSGILVLLGIASDDTPVDAENLADKIVNLRIFEDDTGKMNRSLIDNNGEMLIVSQFTLLGDCQKGRRPSFIKAAKPEIAIPLYEHFITRVAASDITVQTGQFGAMMEVSIINDGPVTLIVETKMQ